MCVCVAGEGDDIPIWTVISHTSVQLSLFIAVSLFTFFRDKNSVLSLAFFFSLIYHKTFHSLCPQYTIVPFGVLGKAYTHIDIVINYFSLNSVFIRYALIFTDGCVMIMKRSGWGMKRSGWGVHGLKLL